MFEITPFEKEDIFRFLKFLNEASKFVKPNNLYPIITTNHCVLPSPWQPTAVFNVIQMPSKLCKSCVGQLSGVRLPCQPQIISLRPLLHVLVHVKCN